MSWHSIAAHRITQGNEECSSRELGIEKVEVVDVRSLMKWKPTTSMLS